MEEFQYENYIYKIQTYTIWLTRRIKKSVLKGILGEEIGAYFLVEYSIKKSDF